jgi:hypothetical protein
VKRLYHLLTDFIRQDFNWKTYGLIAAWAAIALIINFSLDLENSYIDDLPTNGLRFLGYLLLYATIYYTAVFLVLAPLSKPERKVKLSCRFWVVSFLGIGIFSADSGFVWHQYIIDAFSVPIRMHHFWFAVLGNALEFITIALPLLVVNQLLIPNRTDNLGINKKEIDLKPFFIMLLMIAPFIFFSAYEKGLNNYYPTFRYARAAQALDWPVWPLAVLYEVFYGLDFFNVELMFRGFMVVGMAQLLGRHALLPMAVFYCAIHFGKPLAEAVSSLFGGYILGALAFQTRAIWGGVIVHMGLAWLMELSAFAAKTIYAMREWNT